MIALIQRVSKGSVTIEEKLLSSIDHGYVILLGIFKEDTEQDIEKLIPKILHLRVMNDENGVMNKSILETNGELLVVSQFTLCADTRKGRRPSYINAMRPESAKTLYELFIRQLTRENIPVKTGVFGGLMRVEVINDGPVTILLNSSQL
ncbi:D-tyrosyl-tRNA(Tyr) deacylase [Candidatus Roizmanbacteria bacterium CG_4_10_14_0_2_um_filter_39_13]|uniref:D-aminoacyl-tRNA deacylase n=1 Tax=Candidatus Roizmanbacteria bacterium CG_4_10_14_0_2_um_filter_39_13 TaxID=1974825 RepID=A0A2M7U0B3_9BACT|nr:MAG: D-tyrosyl-tRNA(Tyr) deacylase [Candidatus Roizmanbacteria bacterium CG_4_10_14_0_2_um_filter_39_13]